MARPKQNAKKHTKAQKAEAKRVKKPVRRGDMAKKRFTKLRNETGVITNFSIIANALRNCTSDMLDPFSSIRMTSTETEGHRVSRNAVKMMANAIHTELCQLVSDTLSIKRFVQRPGQFKTDLNLANIGKTLRPRGGDNSTLRSGCLEAAIALKYGTGVLRSSAQLLNVMNDNKHVVHKDGKFVIQDVIKTNSN